MQADILDRGHQWLGDEKPNDPVAASVFDLDESDEEVRVRLSKICEAPPQVLRRQCCDQLPGVKFADATTYPVNALWLN